MATRAVGNVRLILCPSLLVPDAESDVLPYGKLHPIPALIIIVFVAVAM